MDPVDFLTIKNKSKRYNYFVSYENSKIDSVVKENCINEIDIFIDLWRKKGADQYSYLQKNENDTIFYYYNVLFKNGGIEKVIDSHEDIYYFKIINADILFENYQKGLPVDSFKSYEIKKYTREELKKSDYQIIINE
jgi:hypothetical protein